LNLPCLLRFDPYLLHPENDVQDQKENIHEVVLHENEFNLVRFLQEINLFFRQVQYIEKVHDPFDLQQQNEQQNLYQVEHNQDDNHSFPLYIDSHHC